MSPEKIIQDWKKKIYKPIYWLEGEEGFFINQVMDYAEQHLLPESEKAFNQSVFYGKDADWAAVVNACRRYPMFAERQVVLLKEAQQMRDISRLEPYIQQPLDSTILVISYKDKKVDGRSKLAKLLKEKGEVLSTKKIYENQLPEWVSGLAQSKGFSMAPRALSLLIDHIGNDLMRINSEIDKMAINLGSRKTITEDDIETFVGISKEFNAFELQDALVKKDLAKAFRIVQYFQSNPKAGPIQLVLPSLYNFFSKVYMLFGLPSRDEKTAASVLGVNPFFVKDYLLAARNYGLPGIENALLLLHTYNLKSVGINSVSVDDASLMKELIVKLM
ncbi:MAG: DNA polymerase III subunit delta [Bacteroidota bacterium]|nr:DNA polymerase III subunit delta [Bacteroidota bacterium]MDP4213808.1 DNA polymerase III subunit delta [Bacteroidota bacterium]MDP4249632.1 DNA polymerase III subunit delta [Bacteroidota bacterium]